MQITIDDVMNMDTLENQYEQHTYWPLLSSMVTPATITCLMYADPKSWDQCYSRVQVVVLVLYWA